MNDDTDNPAGMLDENTRRYYLDVMGVQCWQLREAENVHATSKDTNVADTAYVVLDKSVQQCTACHLHKTRKQTIMGRGSLTADILFVLLAPTSNDDDVGILCSGDADILFSKMLSAINVSIDDIYITSLLKCKVSSTHTISPKEVLACDKHLTQLVQLIKPKLVVVLGETTIRCLLQNNLSLDDFRAMNIEAPYQLASVPIFVSYAPHELLQQVENKRKAWADLQQLQTLIET